MSSTNKTSHYELSQYVGNDKPTYLVDYNTDMQKIDAGIYGAKNEADTNATNIGDLANLSTETKSALVNAINEVYSTVSGHTTYIGELQTNVSSLTSNVGNLANLITTNKSNLVSAINENKTGINALNNKIGTFTIRDYSDGTNLVVENGSLTTNNVCLAYSTDMSIFKLYGFVRLTKTAGANAKIRFKLPTGMNNLVTSDYVIRCAVAKGSSNNSDLLGIQNITFDKTNNELVYESGGSSDTANYLFFLPCVYFNQVFNVE